MSSNTIATDNDIKSFLQSHSDWQYDHKRNVLEKTFTLKSYFKGLNFVQVIGWLAQKHNHHPDITLTFTQIKILLKTHDLGNKVSQLDLMIADKIDALWF